MVRGAQAADGQSPTPSTGEEGTDLRSVARNIEGLLDDDGHFNPGNTPSRAHPDYDESADPRAQSPDRDERGRFKAATDDAPAGETAEDDEIEDLSAATGDDSDADAGDASDTDEDLAASADDAKDDETDTGTIETVAELAEALETSPDELFESLSHTFNAAGEEVTVTLTELIKGYQKDADYRRSTAKLAQDRAETEQQFQQRHQLYEQQNHLLAQTLNASEQMLAAELDDPRLAALRESDPAEWTARRDEIGQRLNGLRNYRMQAAQAYDQHTTELRTQLRQREESALLEALPDFGSEHKAKAKGLLSEMGYQPHEISEIVDHRLIVGVLELADAREELAELRQLKQQAEQTTKRVKKEIPKLTRPGKQRRKAPAGLRRDNIAKLRKRAAQSGKVEDAAKVIEQLL